MTLVLACAPNIDAGPGQTPPGAPEPPTSIGPNDPQPGGSDAARPAQPVPDTAPAGNGDVVVDAGAGIVDAAAGDPGGLRNLGGGLVSAALVGYQLMVRPRADDGSAGAPVPFDIRGISWSPAARGAGKPDGAAYLAAADRDLPLMRAAGINVVKSYGPLPRAVLDKLQAHGIAAVVSVLGTADDEFEATVNGLRDHPALLFWIIGNEWNLNRLFDSCALDACFERVNQVAQRIKQLDPNHPVATSFAPAAEIPSDADLMRLPAVDIWGLNVYSQPGFFNRFTAWRLAGQRTGIKKPIFFSEYGADAYDNRAGHADEAAQAMALRRQTMEIRAQLSAHNPVLPCLGGTPFEWNDEWWKRGNPGAQDSGGFAHAGVAADGFANEEWWGVVDVDRHPRPAYEVLKELYAR